jgi:hypothetical protein
MPKGIIAKGIYHTFVMFQAQIETVRDHTPLTFDIYQQTLLPDAVCCCERKDSSLQLWRVPNVCVTRL